MNTNDGYANIYAGKKKQQGFFYLKNIFQMPLICTHGGRKAQRCTEQRMKVELHGEVVKKTNVKKKKEYKK